MNCISFHTQESFNVALNALALEAAPEYQIDEANLTIWSTEIRSIAALLNDNGIFKFDRSWNEENEGFDGFRTDAEADGDALRSAGFGTDEDYGYYGGNDE